MRVSTARNAGIELNPWCAARRAGLVAALVILGGQTPQQAKAVGETRTITLHHIHTNEDITITYKKDGRYDEAALKRLNTFVRDWRKNEEVRMDPQLFDYMWEVQHEVGYTRPIHIICGYRSPATNSMLRRRSRGVARTSLHMAGKAMDFALPGADIAKVRAAALRIQGGGVGYYPTSGIPFVHVDVGNVRHWPRMTRDQLVRVFPNGRTLHVPTDGRPLPGYEIAMAEHGRDVARRSHERKSRSLMASLFSKSQDEEERADIASTKSRAAAPARRHAPAKTQTAHATSAKTQTAAAAPEAAPEAVPVPLPPQRPMFQIASAESRPALLSSRPAPAVARQPTPPVATPASANEVITDRGYWQGLPEAGPAISAASRVIASHPAKAGADITGNIGPFASGDRLPSSTVALAYAAPGEPPRHTAGHVPAVVTTKPDATVAAKPIRRAAAASVRAVPAGDRLDDPWMRGVVMAPSMQNSMTATVLGATDFRGLVTFMQKPGSSVLMTFSADPYLGMITNRFTGSAIVFQATVTYGMRTAALR